MLVELHLCGIAPANMKLLYLILGGCTSFFFGVLCQDTNTTPDPAAVSLMTTTTNSIDQVLPTNLYHEVDLSLQVVTPQCIQANIMGGFDQDGTIFTYDNEDLYAISMWTLDVSISKWVQSGQRAQTNMTHKLSPSLQSTTIAPVSTGAEVTVMLGYKTRDGARGHRSTNNNNLLKIKSITLPDSDENCQEPYGRRQFPCSECICASRAYGGIACKEPMFYPVNVSALPGSSQSLHIQWDFNETYFRRDFNTIGLSMAGFIVNVSKVSSRESSTFTLSTMVPPSERSFIADDGIEPGVTYEVVVGTVVRYRPGIMESVIHANSPPVQVLIQVAEGTLEPCLLPTTELSEQGDAQTSLAAGVIIITVVIFVMVGLLATPIVIGVMCVYVRKRWNHDATLVATSSVSHSRDPNTPRLEWNPSYGQLPSPLSGNHTTTSNTINTSSSNGLYAVLEGGNDEEQRTENSRTEQTNNTGNGTDMYDYITPPRI